MKTAFVAFVLLVCLSATGAHGLGATSFEGLSTAYRDWEQAREEVESAQDARDEAAATMWEIDQIVDDAESGMIQFPIMLYGYFWIESIADLYDFASMWQAILEGFEEELEHAQGALADAEDALAEAVDGYDWADGDLDRFYQLLSYMDMLVDEELIQQLEDLFWRIIEAVENGEEDLADELREQFDNPEQEF